MNCGKNIGDEAICPYCGYIANPDTPSEASQAPQPSYGTAPANTYQEPQAYAPYQPSPAPYGFGAAPAQEQPMYSEGTTQPLYTEGGTQPLYGGSETPTQPLYTDGSTQPLYPGAQPPYYENPVQSPYSAPGEYPQPAAESPEPPKKKKKTGLIIGIIAAAVVLLAGAGLLVFFLTADARQYSKAMDLKDDGKYQEAIEIFTELGDYDDSATQITDCRYLEAKKMLADGQYDKAIAAFTALKDYKDSETMIKQCDYERAEKLLADGQYDEAKDYFKSLGDYSDSETKIKACDYALAKDMIESNPADAIKKLEALGDYEDSAELIKEAKLNYCKDHDSNTNTTTYKYLKELKAANYPGASELYNELYTYKVTNIYWNTSKDNTNSSSNMSSISVKNNQVLHFTLLGGTPDDEDMDIKYTVTWPSGSKNNSGFTGGRSKYYTITLTSSSIGTLKVDIYTESGTLLHTATVTVTS